MTNEQKSKIEWVLRIVISVTGAVTLLLVSGMGWFIRDIYAEQKKFNADVDSRIRALEHYRAELAGSQFTMPQWTAAKAALDDRASSFDKRITRTEDAVLAIKDTLGRIEAKLDKIDQRTR